MKKIVFVLNFIIFFSVIDATKAETKLVTPKDNQLFHKILPVILTWNSLPLETLPIYNIQIALDSSFTNIVTNIATTNTSYTFIPTQALKHFIRIKSDKEIWSKFITIQFLKIDTISQIIAWQSADSLVAETSNQVSAWSDIVNDSRIVNQTNPANQPSFISNVDFLNNKPAISFNGLANPSYFNISPSISSSDFSIYILRNRKANSTLFQTFMGDAGGGGLYSDFSQANIGYGIFNPTTGINNFTQLSALVNDYSIYLTTNKNLYRNNVLDAAGTKIPSISINAIGTRLDNPPFSFFGEIAEYIYFNSILDSTNNNTVHNYFKSKYAPPVNLGTDLVFGTSFCDTVRIYAGKRFKSFLWSTGETTESIIAVASKTYSVIAKDIFGVTSSDDISVLPYKKLANKTEYLCIGDTLKLDLLLPPTFNVLWSNGINSPKVKLSEEGKYTVSITDSKGCTFKDTINIVVNKTNYSPAIINKQVTMCEGEKLFLLSNIPFDSIRWSTGVVENYISVITPGVYSAFAQTTNGCIIKDTFNITIAGKAPTSNFSISAACQNASTNFNDISIPPSGNTIVSWKWSFSNNTTASSQNTNSIFNNLGTAIASLKITTNLGCSDSISKTFMVNKRPVANFYNLLSCAKNPTTFVDQSLANATTFLNWEWDFAGLGTSNLIQNPSFKFPEANTYNVKLTVTNSNNCRDSIIIPTSVNPSPTSNFSFDSACGKNPVSFKFLATVPSPNTITAWSWNFGDFEAENAIKSPQHSYEAPGNYDVQLIVRSSNQCIDTIEKKVKVFDFPLVDFTVSQTQCVGKSIQFTDISFTPDGTPMNKWNWYFSGQGTSNQQNPTYTFNNEGNYIIQLTSENNVGCSGTKLRSIAVSSLPTPKFTFSPQNGLPPLNVSYFNQSTATSNYLWSYGDGGGFIEGYNPPPHTYTTIGTYPIQLVATDFKGCTDTLTKFILVDKAYLDGVMASITIIPNGEYYQIKATILNNSNVQITSLGLGLQLGGGAVIREIWTGSLLPGETVVYTFTGEIKLAETSQIPVVCASIENINNNSPEDRTDNNSTCKATKVGSFDIFTIFPNPADANINFGVMLPRSGDVTIRFINYLGQILYNQDFSGAVGYNNFSMTTLPLASGVYVAEVYYDGNVIRQKFMRKSIQ